MRDAGVALAEAVWAGAEPGTLRVIEVGALDGEPRAPDRSWRRAARELRLAMYALLG